MEATNSQYTPFTLPINNIYTANGTLTNNRILNIHGKTFKFTDDIGANDFTLESTADECHFNIISDSALSSINLSNDSGVSFATIELQGQAFGLVNPIGNGHITFNPTTNGSIGIHTTNPNDSAALDIASTTKGLLLPRMTKVQRNAISSPPQGLLVFVNDNGGYLSWYNSGWQKITSSAD